MLSHFSHVQFFETPWTVAHQAPLSMGFSMQEYWSGLPFPVPGDLPDPGIELTSLMSPALAGRFFTTSATWEAHQDIIFLKIIVLEASISQSSNIAHSIFIYKLINQNKARDCCSVSTSLPAVGIMIRA